MKLYQAIACKLIAIENCIRSANWEWKERHEDTLNALIQSGPSGGGIDAGIELLVSECKPDRLVFSCDFHHMDEFGGYDGWTDHKAIVTPSLFNGIDVRITGRNRNDIKSYLEDVLSQWLTEEYTQPSEVAAA